MPTTPPRTITRTDNALHAMAADVNATMPCAFRAGNARDAARALTGLASWVVNRVGLARMQECMSELARYEPAWRAPFMRDLPTQYNGRIDEWVAMIAVVASSLAPAFGGANLRSAMAWWATEGDPAAWQAIVG